MDATSCYHEAGHAVMAVWLGGQVLQVSVEPEQDVGPRLDGDVKVLWFHGGLTQRQSTERELMAVLAGPIAEMIYLGKRSKLSAQIEWASDWQTALQLAAGFKVPASQRSMMLEVIVNKLFTLMSKELFWQTIAEVADQLDAHETIEGEIVEECVERWIGR